MEILVIIVTPLITVAIAAFVYHAYQKLSLDISMISLQMSERLGRWSIVAELEKEIGSYHSEKWALEIETDLSNGQTISENKLELRHVLDNIPDWTFVEDESSEAKGGFRSSVGITYEGLRYWQIREKKDENRKTAQYVCSPAFHWLMLWFRKTDRALRANILLDDEAVDWWRQVLPLGWAGRLEYFRKYFEGSKDIESMAIVLSAIINALERKGHANALDYCRFFNGSDRDVLKGIGGNGVRAVKTLDSHR